MKFIKNALVVPMVIAGVFGVQNSHSAGIAFEDLWQKVLAQSPELAAQKHFTKASELSLDRSKLHWAPSLGLQASAYSTNSPSSNFFGILSQRSVTSQDFSPNSLNAPGYNTFQSMALGLDLPIYEGGQKNETVTAMTAQHESEQIQLELKKRILFSETLDHYGNLMADVIAQSKLAELKQEVQKILSKYAIGSKSNPVGYSGILGLKGLNNRIDAEMISIEASKKSHQIALAEKSGMAADQLKPVEQSVSRLVSLKTAEQSGRSFAEELALRREQAYVAGKNAERARYLPKVGLFANESVARGSRDVGYATTVGVYLAWSLFSPENYNKYSEQKERSEAAIQQRELEAQSSRISRQTLVESEKAIEETIRILIESDQLLAEQVKVAGRLFQSGSISALQVSEVYNRRTDLILSARQSEKQLIEIKGKKILTGNADQELL